LPAPALDIAEIGKTNDIRVISAFSGILFMIMSCLCCSCYLCCGVIAGKRRKRKEKEERGSVLSNIEENNSPDTEGEESAAPALLAVSKPSKAVALMRKVLFYDCSSGLFTGMKNPLKAEPRIVTVGSDPGFGVDLGTSKEDGDQLVTSPPDLESSTGGMVRDPSVKKKMEILGPSPSFFALFKSKFEKQKDAENGTMDLDVRAFFFFLIIIR
jgi:hypothetical protein